MTFAYERGLEIGNVHDSASLAATYALAHRATTAVLDDRVGLLRITYPVGDDAVRLTVDADLDVVAVDHRCA